MCILSLLQLWEEDEDEDGDEENIDTTWGGSQKGKSPNKNERISHKLTIL
jgi:hypothetical protein